MNVQNACSDASGENDSRHELVTCPRCNQTVSCKPTSISACWCIQEKVSRETLQKLEGMYNGCLCKECLVELAGSENAT